MTVMRSDIIFIQRTEKTLKNKIIINLSKDTPPETISALTAILKAQKEKGNKPLYLSNEDIENLNARYDELYKKVKDSTHLSTAQINRECEVLLEKYNFEIEELSAMRKVDYEIRLAEIEARRDELKPWRRSWWRRLLFLPLTNRAQDIIDESAELEAERVHGAAEKLLDAARELLFPGKEKTRLKRKEQNREEAQKQFEENRRQAEKKLEEILRKADEEDEPAKVYEEPPAVPPAQESVTEIKKPLPGQMTFADVQEQARPVPFATSSRRPRPPRSCRKQ